jgi:glutamine amidotransferase
VIALIDYGIGNLRSVEKALATVGADVRLTADPGVILSAARVVLPGVGAFGDGVAGLKARGLVEVLKTLVARQTPLLGICLGMQLLFDASDERGHHAGLGFLPGRVRRFPFAALTYPAVTLAPHATLAPKRSAGGAGGTGRASPDGDLKVPQTGWNQILPARDHPLLRGLPPGSYAYFNHGYYCEPVEASDVLARTEYGLRYASVVGRGRLYGVQFHPEKSQAVGLTILKNFVEWCV